MESVRDILMTEGQVMEGLGGLTRGDMEAWRRRGLPYAEIKRGLRVYRLSDMLAWAERNLIKAEPPQKNISDFFVSASN